MTEATHHCPACGAALESPPAIVGRDRLHGTPGRFEVLMCAACGSGLTLPVVPEDELGRYYPSDYNAYALPDQPLLRALATLLFRWRYWRGLRRPPLSALTGRTPGRLLDVGGGRGDLGVVLGRHGWHVTSLEPSEAACDEAQARGVDALPGTLTNPPAQLPDGFDAIVFQHSLEHVADVPANLRAAYKRLEPGGLLLITLPNFACWQRRRFGADWFHLDLPRHRAHFTPIGLELALAHAGFKGIQLSTSSSADGLPTTLQYRLRESLLRSGPLRYVVAALGVTAAPLTAAVNAATGGGDILHAVSNRPCDGAAG